MFFKTCALILVVAAMAQGKPQSYSSSSSSSSSSSGGPVYFGGGSSSNSFSSGGQGFPGANFQSFGFPDFGGFGFAGGFPQYPQQFQSFGFGDYGGDLGVRLGSGPGVQSVHVGASQQNVGNGGSYSSSSSGIDSNGNVHFHAEKGKF
ncbi:keratin, type I cytoskeletal 10-like isoform X1 [Neocloeon triangulifer]|uniref:keratin, type I cytoskeletal 10-like isoform X1 n=1 Tax=Neocloeon triangulifer TaxID=2078957 RepID=UPI00286EBEFD|nr:keratin, type I cytoskeletal 10-like isoform X1 [Neocloeon triangulifer]